MANRWWVYQKARFPVFKHGLQVAVLSISAVGYSRVLREGLPLQSLTDIPSLFLLAFIALFLLVLQRHVVEELNAGSKMQTKPKRSLARGLVLRRELMILAIAAGLIQLGLALAIGLPMVGLLLLIWGYLELSQRVLVLNWLNNHPQIEVWVRTLFLPLLTLYAAAHDWVIAGATAPIGLVWLLLSSWGSALTLEIERQIGAPRGEDPDALDTVPVKKQLVMSAWLLTVWLVTVATLLAARQIPLLAPVALIVLLLLTGSLLIVWQFLAHPGKPTRRRLNQMSQLWLLGSHLSIGILPLWIGR